MLADSGAGGADRHRPGPEPGRRAWPPTCPRSPSVYGAPPALGARRGRRPARVAAATTWLYCSTPRAPRARPKGAMLSHRALLANHDQLDAIEPPVVGPDDIVLLALPLFHAYGLNAGLGAVVHHGATGVLLDELEADGGAGRDRPAPGQRAGRRTVDVPDLGRSGRGPRGDRVGAGGGVRRGAAGARGRGALHRGHRPPGARRVRADRDRAGAHLHPGRRRSPRPARSAGRCRACELRLVGPDGVDLWRDGQAAPTTTRTTMRHLRRGAGHRPGARSSCAAPTCSPATGRTVGTARTPTAGGPPATSPTPTPTATSSWSTGSAS